MLKNLMGLGMSIIIFSGCGPSFDPTLPKCYLKVDGVKKEVKQWICYQDKFFKNIGEYNIHVTKSYRRDGHSVYRDAKALAANNYVYDILDIFKAEVSKVAKDRNVNMKNGELEFKKLIKLFSVYKTRLKGKSISQQVEKKFAYFAFRLNDEDFLEKITDGVVEATKKFTEELSTLTDAQRKVYIDATESARKKIMTAYRKRMAGQSVVKKIN